MARNWGKQLKQLMYKTMDLPARCNDGPAANYNDRTITYLY